MANLPSLWRGSPLRSMRETGNPFRDMVRFQREIDKVFDDFWNFGGQENRSLMEGGFQPACDCQETETHYLYSFDLPGIKKEDVKIELLDNSIHVSGERKEEHEESRKGRFQSERFYGAFERWIPLPGNVKSENVEAHMENGVLQVAIPKSEEMKTKEIKIEEGKSGVFSKLLGKKEEKKETAA